MTPWPSWLKSTKSSQLKIRRSEYKFGRRARRCVRAVYSRFGREINPVVGRIVGQSRDTFGSYMCNFTDGIRRFRERINIPSIHSKKYCARWGCTKKQSGLFFPSMSHHNEHYNIMDYQGVQLNLTLMNLMMHWLWLLWWWQLRKWQVPLPSFEF